MAVENRLTAAARGMRCLRPLVIAAGIAVLALPAPADAQAGFPVPRPRPDVDRVARAGDLLRQASVPASADRAEVLRRISDYFNSLRTLEGEFVQVGPDGSQSEGVFFMQRPGKVRFHYRPPARLDVIADGRSVAIQDQAAKTQDIYPLSKTPLRFLLADRVDLTSDRVVRNVVQEADLISLVVADQSLGDGKLTLIFDSTTYELRQWIVTDAQGYDTSVAIYNIAAGKPQDPQLFRIYVSQEFQQR